MLSTVLISRQPSSFCLKIPVEEDLLLTVSITARMNSKSVVLMYMYAVGVHAKHSGFNTCKRSPSVDSDFLCCRGHGNPVDLLGPAPSARRERCRAGHMLIRCDQRAAAHKMHVCAAYPRQHPGAARRATGFPCTQQYIITSNYGNRRTIRSTSLWQQVQNGTRRPKQPFYQEASHRHSAMNACSGDRTEISLH